MVGIYIVSILSAMYGLMLLLLFCFQHQLLFKPEKTSLDPALYQLPSSASLLTLTTKDNLSIKSWWLPHPTSPLFLIYFHGNAGHLGHRATKLSKFAEEYNVFALSYRGYGESQGTPSEKGLYLDAEAAVEYLLGQGVSRAQIILYGESLGTGVATRTAWAYPGIKGVFLEAPYSSIAALAKRQYPWVPIDYLLQHRFDSIDYVTKIETPIFIIHGTQDSVIPHHESLKLQIVIPNLKELVLLEKIGHTDFPLITLSESMKKFIEAIQSE